MMKMFVFLLPPELSLTEMLKMSGFTCCERIQQQTILLKKLKTFGFMQKYPSSIAKFLSVEGFEEEPETSDRLNKPTNQSF